MISRRASNSFGVGVTYFSLEDQGGVCFDLEEGSSSSEIGGDTLVGRRMHFDLATHATERNIVGVARFCACANLLTLFCPKYSCYVLMVQNVCWEASCLKISCFGLL